MVKLQRTKRSYVFDEDQKPFRLKKISEKLAFNPQAVGRDTGVQLSLSNFQDDILKPTSFKMSPTSNSSL